MTTQSAMTDINILAASFSLPMHDFQTDVTSYPGDNISPDHFSPAYDNSQSSGLGFQQPHQQPHQQHHGPPHCYVDNYSFDSGFVQQRDIPKTDSYGATPVPATTSSNSFHRGTKNSNSDAVSAGKDNTAVTNSNMFVEATNVEKYPVLPGHGMNEDAYAPSYPGHNQDYYTEQQRYVDSSSRFGIDPSKSYLKHHFSEGSNQELLFPQPISYSDLDQKHGHAYGHTVLEPQASGAYCHDGGGLYQSYHPAFYLGQGAHYSPGMPFHSPSMPHGSSYRSDFSLPMPHHQVSHLHHPHRRTSLTIPTPPVSDR